MRKYKWKCEPSNLNPNACGFSTYSDIIALKHYKEKGHDMRRLTGDSVNGYPEGIFRSNLEHKQATDKMWKERLEHMW